MNFPQIKESSELSRLKAFADNDLDSTCGFVQGGTDEFSKNNTDQENNTITFSLYNPTTSPLDVQLYGFDPANFTTVPVNTPPTIINGPFPILPGGGVAAADSSSLCVPNNTLYVVDGVNNTVTVIDCATNVSVAIIAIPIGFTPTPACYCPINNQMYIGSSLFNQVIRINCNTNTIVGVPIITTNAFSLGLGLVYNSVKNSIYGLDNSAPTNIIEINCSSNIEIAFFTSGFFPVAQISPMCFNPLLNKIYINDATLNLLHILDCGTNTFPLPIALPFIPSTLIQANVYCPFNNSVYITSSAVEQYVQVNCATLLVSPPLPTGLVGTNNIIYNPINNLIYIVGSASVDYAVLDVVTNIISLPIGLLFNCFYFIYNQNNNTIFGIFPPGSLLTISPLFAPTVTINLPGGITPAMIYNDTQTKPFLIRGVRIITDNFSQWSNNITFSNNSYTGALDAKQWQPLNYISPTSPNSTIVDAPDFILDVDRGPDSTALDFKIEPLTNVILLFTVGKTLDSSTIFCQQDKEHVDNTTAIRYTGNPIADIFLSTMTKEQITEQESKYSSVEYADYPRETGNPIADIALLRNYGIQGI